MIFFCVKAESARGDVAKSTECYMTEAGTSKEATEHVKGLVGHSWKKLNEESYNNSVPRSMINMCLNMARTSQCIFQHGDGIGTSTGATKDLLMSLIVEKNHFPRLNSSLLLKYRMILTVIQERR